MLTILDDDCVCAAGSATEIRLSLPWIRSLPLASVSDVVARINDEHLDDLVVTLGSRHVAPASLSEETGWWFLQDRLVLTTSHPVAASARVEVEFRLMVPYLPGGPDRPLTLPFHAARTLSVRSTTPTRSGGGDVR